MAIRKPRMISPKRPRSTTHPAKRRARASLSDNRKKAPPHSMKGRLGGKR